MLTFSVDLGAVKLLGLDHDGSKKLARGFSRKNTLELQFSFSPNNDLLRCFYKVDAVARS